MRPRPLHLVFVVGALLVAAATAVPVEAQDVTADVKTWGGRSWRLTQPSFEVFYTIVPLPKEGEAGGLQAEGAGVPVPTGAAGQGGGARMFGTQDELRKAMDRGAEPVHAQGEKTYLTLSRDGVEVQVPFAQLASLQIARTPVLTSGLPPHVAGQHFRYSASAVLTDGSRVEGDYINLGTTLLRGLSPQGRIDVPLEEIEALRFER